MKAGLIARIGAKLSNASPEILVGAGIATMVAGVVVAVVKDSKKTTEILQEQQQKHDEIVENHSEEEQQLPAVKREHAKVSLQTIGRVIWHHKCAIGLVVGGATMVVAGFKIEKARYIRKAIECNALAAASAGLQKAYDAVLDRVRSRYGEEGYNYAKYGLEKETYEEETVDEKGKTHKEKKERWRSNDVFDSIRKSSPWAIIFDEDSKLYQECNGSIIHMRSQLEAYERVLNEQYHGGVPIFFNDIVRWTDGNDSEYLCNEGQICGNYKNDIANRESGDDCIDLRINTFIGPDVETGEDTVYLMIDPNIAGPISLDSPRRIQGRFGGKYISQPQIKIEKGEWVEF